MKCPHCHNEVGRPTCDRCGGSGYMLEDPPVICPFCEVGDAVMRGWNAASVDRAKLDRENKGLKIRVAELVAANDRLADANDRLEEERMDELWPKK